MYLCLLFGDDAVEALATQDISSIDDGGARASPTISHC